MGRGAGNPVPGRQHLRRLDCRSATAHHPCIGLPTTNGDVHAARGSSGQERPGRPPPTRRWHHESGCLEANGGIAIVSRPRRDGQRGPKQGLMRCWPSAASGAVRSRVCVFVALVLVACGEGTGVLGVYPVDGAAEATTSHLGGTSHSAPVVSPNGQAPLEDPGDRRLIRRFVGSGGTVWSFWDIAPSAAPDGRIMVTAGGEENAGIHLLDPASGGRTMLHPTDPPWRPRTAAFAPDGERIAFLETRMEPGSNALETRVSVIDIEDRAVHHLGVVPGILELILRGGTDFSPCWSAAGARILFTTTTPARMQSRIHVVSSDGSSPPRRLTTAPDVVDRSVSCLGSP